MIVGLAWSSSRRELITVFVAQLVVAASAPLRVIVAASALRVLVPTHGHPDVSTSLVLFGLLLAATRYAQIYAREYTRLLGELLGRAVVDRLIGAADGIDLIAFEDPDFHDRLRRMRDSHLRCVQAITGAMGIVGAVLGTVGTVAALSSVQRYLVPLALVALVPTTIATRRNSQAEYDFVVSTTASDRSRFYIESLLLERSAAKEIRALEMAPHLRLIHHELADARVARLRALVRSRMRRSLLTSALTLVASASLGGALIWLYAWRGVSLASAAAAGYGLVILMGQLNSAVRTADTLHQSLLFVNELDTFLRDTPARDQEVTDSPRARPAEFAGVALDSVTFTYPGASRPAVSDVSLHIAPGEVVALVGPNGSGKTTAASLVAGLYKPESGRVAWEAASTSDLDWNLTHDRVAICFQDFQRFRMSVTDNIAAGDYGRRQHHDEVRSAAELSRASAFVAGLPDGYSTLLGPEFVGGFDLSEGQWQRLAVARVFFRNAQLVILDEPTAALDPMAEHELFETLREAVQDRAALVISHRLATVRTASRIYVMDQGRIAEFGTHEELIARRGLYAHLFEIQARPFVSGDERVTAAL